MEYLQNIDWFAYADKLIISVCILILAWLIGVRLNGMLKDKLAERISDDESRIKNIFFKALQGLPISGCLMIGLYFVAGYFPRGIGDIFEILLSIVLILTVARAIEQALSGLIEWKISAASNIAQTSLLSIIVKTFIYSLAVIIILDRVNISIAPLITAMGVGGMAVAFGVQETVANIFSGLHLIITKQVKINDFIKLSSGEEGRVSDINLRYTTITPAAEGSVIVIPNKNIAGAVITNFSLPREDVGIVINMGVSYSSDLDKVERVTLEEARKVQAQCDDYDPDDSNSPLHPAVLYQEFGDSSINFWAVLHASTYGKQLKIKHEFIKAITRRYREEGIDIPFPIRTIYLPEEDTAATDEKVAISKKKG